MKSIVLKVISKAFLKNWIPHRVFLLPSESGDKDHQETVHHRLRNYPCNVVSVGRLVHKKGQKPGLGSPVLKHNEF